MIFAMGNLFLLINSLIEQKYKINTQLLSRAFVVCDIILFIVQTNNPTTRFGNQMDANKKLLEAASVLACCIYVAFELGFRGFEMAIAFISVGKNKFFKVAEICICGLQHYDVNTQSYGRIWRKDFVS
jgi:hypothetical protein